MKAYYILNVPFKLSKEQEQIITSENKYIKVEAAAGTGKTETIARKILYLITEENVEPKGIVAFTFTEKAAMEMKLRIYNIASNMNDENLINKLGEINIGTIHSYCKKILEDQFNYGNHILFDENKEIAFLLKNGYELGIDNYENKYTESVLTFHRSVNMVYNELIDERRLNSISPEFCEKFKKYEDLLNKNKILTFGKLIADTVRELQKNKNKIKELGISYLFVDEFQDINPAQYELIKLLVSESAGLIVVGDERQTIYQWRGSNYKLFKELEKDFNDIKTFYLNENRRSLKNIVENANHFSKSLEGNYNNMIATNGEEQDLIINSFNDRKDEANWIANTIQELVNSGNLKYQDIAILIRSVKYYGEEIIDKLMEKNIPYQVGGKTGLFQREEGEILGMIFIWLANGDWMINGKKLNNDDLLSEIINKSQKIFKTKNINSRNFEKIKNNIYNSFGKNNYENINEIFQDVLTALNFQNMNPDDPLDAAKMANIGRFNNLLTDFETARRIGGRKHNWRYDLKDDLKDDLNALYWYIKTYAQTAYEEAQPDIDYELNAVQVMTIHQAKGLEWPFVILAEVNEKNFPSSQTGGELNWCEIPRKAFDLQRYEGTIDDERRLFYVAITRPRDILAITYINNKKSKFLNDINLKLFSNYDIKKVNWYRKNQNNETILEFTPSELIWYYRCPYMYRMRKIWGYQPGLVEELGFGNAMHNVLRNAAEMYKSGEVSIESVIKESSDRYFHLPFADRNKFNKLKKESEDILDAFVRKYPEFIKKAEDVEYRVSYNDGKVIISGKADLILNDDTGIVVVDYKTNKNVNTIEEIEIQLGAYVLGLKKRNFNVRFGKVVYLQENEYEDILFNDEKINDISTKIENIIKGIMEKNFKPKLGSSCYNCDMKKVCKYGGDNGRKQ